MMIRVALCSFLSGVAVASGFGYFQLHQDIYKTSSILESSVESVASDLFGKNQLLESRIEALEAILKQAPSQQESTPQTDS